VKVCIYTRSHAPHQDQFHGAFGEGLRAHGIQPEHLITGQWKESDVAVVWGERNRQSAEKFARNVLILERGYYRDRFTFTSAAWNGLNGRGEFCNADSPSDRWEKHGVPVKDWKQGGEYILLLGQVPGDYSHRHTDINGFYLEALAQLGGGALPVVFRPHPLSRGGNPGCMVDASATLEQALSKAAYAVTFNSNSAVDAVLDGVPCITMDEGSMAWDVTGHEWEQPPTPDRTQWLHDLAYCQWSEDEMREGIAWQHLKKGLNA